MEKQSTFLSELISGNTFYVCSNFTDYLNNFDKVKSGRHGVLSGIYGQYELNIAENIDFEILCYTNGWILLKYFNRNVDNSQIFSKLNPNIIHPQYTLSNPFSNESLEVKLDIDNLIKTTPHLLTYPDKRKITPIYDPVIFYKKDTKEHLIIAWRNKRSVQRKRNEKEETRALLERLVPQY